MTNKLFATTLATLHIASISTLSVSMALIGSIVPLRTAAAQAEPPAPLAITEILPNAVNESTGELFELVNTSDQAVDLAEWEFVDGSDAAQALVVFNGPLVFGSTTTLLPPGQVALIVDKDYAGEYNAELLSVDTSDEIVVVTTASGNLSLANSADGVAVRSAQGIVSDSFSWTSDPGSEVTFAREYNGAGLTALEKSAERTLGFVAEQAPPPTKPDVVLSELLPNPEQGEEYIEIKNGGVTSIDLSMLAVRDASNKQATLSGTLAAGEYQAVYKSETGIALNNDGDTLELIWVAAQDAPVLDTTQYGEAPAGQSWSLINGDFAWTGALTPGMPNVLLEPEPEPSQNKDDPQNFEQETDDEDDEINVTTLESLAELTSVPEGDHVTVAATATTATGLFYANALHVQDTTGAALVRLSKDLSETDVSIGETYSFTGEVDSYSGLTRLTVEHIQPTDTIAVTARDVSPDNLSNNDIGQLVRITGHVKKRSGKSFRIASEKNPEDDLLISVRKNSKITTSAPKKGTAVSVTGIVLASNDQMVVAPRGSADIGDTDSKIDNELLKTGSSLIRLLVLAWVTSGIVMAAWFSGRQVLRRVEWLDLSKSSRDRGGQ